MSWPQVPCSASGNGGAHRSAEGIGAFGGGEGPGDNQRGGAGENDAGPAGSAKFHDHRAGHDAYQQPAQENIGNCMGVS